MLWTLLFPFVELVVLDVLCFFEAGGAGGGLLTTFVDDVPDPLCFFEAGGAGEGMLTTFVDNVLEPLCFFEADGAGGGTLNTVVDGPHVYTGPAG